MQCKESSILAIEVIKLVSPVSMQAGRRVGWRVTLISFTGEDRIRLSLSQDLGKNKGIWKEDNECHFKVNLIKGRHFCGSWNGIAHNFYFTQQETSG